jgi:hypothetical protein
MGCIEIAAYAAAGSSSGGGSSASLLYAGLLWDTGCGRGSPAQLAADAAAEAEAEAAPLPFLAIRKAEGATLGSCMEALGRQQWLAVGQAAGRSLAAFHSLPLPAAVAAAAEAAGGIVGCCTAWAARDGIVYSSAAGTLDMRQGDGANAAPLVLRQRQQQILQRMLPEVSALLHPGQQQQQGPDSSSPAAADGNTNCPRCRAWEPFVAFLRRQRRHVRAAHSKEGSLPAQLLRQLESYLPADPAVLVGCCCSSDSSPRSSNSAPVEGLAAAAAAAAESQPGACTCCGNDSCGSRSSSARPASMPTWVHGDLTAENLLVSSRLLQLAGMQDQRDQQQQLEQQRQEEQQQAAVPAGVILIDFADGGHGDPLWDFVPLLLRTLRQAQQAPGLGQA